MQVVLLTSLHVAASATGLLPLLTVAPTVSAHTLHLHATAGRRRPADTETLVGMTGMQVTTAVAMTVVMTVATTVQTVDTIEDTAAEEATIGSMIAADTIAATTVDTVDTVDMIVVMVVVPALLRESQGQSTCKREPPFP